MSKGDELLIKADGSIFTLTINRIEKRNALSPDCLLKMAETLNYLGKEEKVCTVVIRGSGDQAFSSGYDITAIPEQVPPELEETLKKTSPLDLTLGTIQSFPYPVIAMINGYAYGAGCELAIACDMRIAATHTRMGMPPAKLGLVYPYSGYRRFLSVLGFSHALELFLTGRYYDSQRCLEMGLVNYVAPAGQLESFTYELATELTENAPLSLRGTKFILNKLAEYPVLKPEEEETIRSLFTQSLQSEDAEEGKQAFRERRKPRFKGR